MAAHCGAIFGTKLVSGQLAVQAFYVISGFYMTLVLDTKYNYAGSYWTFIGQRVLRLYPVYYLVAAGTLIAALLTHSQHLAIVQTRTFFPQMSFASKAYLVLTQFTVIGQDITLFTGLRGHPLHLYFLSNFRLSNPQVWRFLLVPQTWTVALEMMFYFLAPFLCRLRLRNIVLLTGGSLLLRYIGYWSFGLAHDPWTYRFFPFELGFFLCGSIGYRFYRRFKPELEAHKLDLLLLFVSLVAFTIFYQWVQHVPSKQHLYYLSVIVLVPGLFAIFKDNHVDRFIGELSYPIYLTHYVLNFYSAHWAARHFPPFYRGAVIAAITISVSIALYLIFERPMDRFRYWLFKRHAPDPGTAPAIP